MINAFRSVYNMFSQQHYRKNKLHVRKMSGKTCTVIYIYFLCGN